jgi:hypothetical protein
MIERPGRRGKQLVDDLKEKRRYWKLKEETLDRTICAVARAGAYPAATTAFSAQRPG